MFKKPDDLGLTEEAALAYGDIMGAASRQGLGMSAPDGMIAAIARSMAAAWLRAIQWISERWDSSSFPHGISRASSGLVSGLGASQRVL
jgi:hypothetical protein